MPKHKQNACIHRTIYFFLLLIIAVLSYRTVLGFTFWIDDWTYLWQSLYKPSDLLFSWMHFGTSLEFFILAKLFGENPLYWELTGIVLRIVSAYAVGSLVCVLSGSRTTGYYAGLIFAGSAIGIQAVGWVNAHVSLLEIIVLTLGISEWIKSIKEKNQLKLIIAFEYILLGMLLDFVRSLPAFALLLYTAWFFGAGGTNVRIRTLLLRGLSLLVLVIPILIYIMLPAFTGSPVYKAGSMLLEHPVRIYTFKYIGNFFGTLWNTTVGWIHPAITDIGSGAPHLQYSLLALIMLCLWVAVLQRLNRISSQAHRIYISFWGLWILVFTGIHWIFEPRITFPPDHRYLVMSGVGSIALMSYALAHTKFAIFRIGILAGLILLNCLSASRILSGYLPYRNRVTFDVAWSEINRQVAGDTGLKIFQFSGEDPLKTNVLNLSGIYPFALKRHIISYDHMPISIDISDDLRVLCIQNKRSISVPVKSVYSWFIDASGKMHNTSDQTRSDVWSALGGDLCRL